MKRFLISAVLLTGMLTTLASAQQPAVFRVRPPELRGVDQWLNSKPLTLEGLRGRVVVVHFWTFG